MTDTPRPTDLRARILKAGYAGLCSTPATGENSAASYVVAALEALRAAKERLPQDREFGFAHQLLNAMIIELVEGEADGTERTEEAQAQVTRTSERDATSEPPHEVVSAVPKVDTGGRVVTPVPAPEPEMMKAKCLDCGLDYSQFGMDLILPRAQWLTIHPDENGLLCALCIIRRASKVLGATCMHGIIEVFAQPPMSPDELNALRVGLDDMKHGRTRTLAEIDAEAPPLPPDPPDALSVEQATKELLTDANGVEAPLTDAWKRLIAVRRDRLILAARSEGEAHGRQQAKHLIALFDDDKTQPHESVLDIPDPYATGRFEVIDLGLPKELLRELMQLAIDKTLSIYYLAAIYQRGWKDCLAKGVTSTP